MSYFGVYDNLEAGKDFMGVRKQAANRAVATATYKVSKTFGSYLNGAGDKDEFNDRVSYVMPEISDIVVKEASFEAIPEVLKTLAWNFDKKDDDDDSDSDKDDDKDEDDSDSDDDSDKASDDKKDDDKDVPDFVDKDDDDDKDRKESSRKFAEEVEDGFTGDLTETTIVPNPVDEDFEGDVNDLQPSGFNAVGAYQDLANDPRWDSHPDAGSRQPVDADYDSWNKRNPDLHEWDQANNKARNEGIRASSINIPGNPVGIDKLAYGEHFNPAPAAGAQWSQQPGTQNYTAPGGLAVQPNAFTPNTFDGATNGFPTTTQPSPTGAQAELEKQVPEIGAPGRHRAPVAASTFPVVARNVKKADGTHFNPAAPAPHAYRAWDDHQDPNNPQMPASTLLDHDMGYSNDRVVPETTDGLFTPPTGKFNPIQQGYHLPGQALNTVDEAKAEVEKTIPQVGAPGRHRAMTEEQKRAALPKVARNAKR